MTKFAKRDIVRVRRSNGTYSETCYVIAEVDGFHCKISELAPDGTIYMPMTFDTSLIERVDKIPSEKIRA